MLESDEPTESNEDTAGEQGIVTPPDNLLAVEMAEHPNNLAAIASTLKAPTQTVHPTRPISLADLAKRSRMTPSAKKREEMTEKMYSLIEKEVKKDVEEVEDEYKFAFLSLAKRANKYLTNDQKEDLLQDVEEVVCQAINKACGREKRSQPAAAPPPPPAQANYVSQPPPPLVNAANLQLTMNNDFFN